VQRLDLMENQEADAGDLAIDPGDERGLGPLGIGGELGELRLAVGDGEPILRKESRMAPLGSDLELGRMGGERRDRRLGSCHTMILSVDYSAACAWAANCARAARKAAGRTGFRR